MSVYIKGFPLPNNCGACPLRLAWCRERIYMVTRPERCPLVPVPDHGDLIDRDETLKKLSPEQIKNVKPDMTWEEIYELNVLDIITMPAIIPAEEGEG